MRKWTMVLMLSVLWLIPTICMAGPPVKGEPTTMEIRKSRKMLDAIRLTETGGEKDPRNAVGKDGEIGPYQITKGYFKDSGIKGRFEQVKSKKFAEKVVVNYMKRYATPKRIGRPATHIDKARMHRGGPNGYKQKRTLAYRTKYLRNYGKK